MDTPKTFAIFNVGIDEELSSKEKKSDFLKNEVFAKDKKYDLNKITENLEFLDKYDNFDDYTILVETSHNIVLNCNEVSAISRIDKSIYIEHKDKIINYYFNDEQPTDSLDLSSLSSKFKFYKEDYQISTFLFILGACAYSENKKIYSIILSNNNIRSLKFSFNIFFKFLKSIDFTGNPLSPEFKPEFDSCYKGISIIKPDPSSTKSIATDDTKTYIIYNKKFTKETNPKEFLLSLTKDSKARNNLDQLEPTFDSDWLLIFVAANINLVSFSNIDTGITSFDKKFFDANKNEITNYYIQNQILNGYLDLSNFRSKFLFFKFQSQINTLLVIIGIWAQKKGIKIKTIDLSDNNITSLKFSFKVFYPEIEKINFYNNMIKISSDDICYKGIAIEYKQNEQPKQDIEPSNPLLQPKQDTKPLNIDKPSQPSSSTANKDLQSGSSNNKYPEIQYKKQNEGKLDIKINKKNEFTMYAIFDKKIGPSTNAKIFLRELIKDDNITNSLNPVYDDELKLIRVETDYNLIDKNNPETSITKFDMQFYINNKNIIIQIFKLITNECLDLSNIKSKIPSYESTRQLSTILIVIGGWSNYNNTIIKKIDLSSNSIKNFKFSFKTVFDKLETIVLADNPILYHKLDDYFNSFKIVKFKPKLTNLPNPPQPRSSGTSPFGQPKQDTKPLFSFKQLQPSSSNISPFGQLKPLFPFKQPLPSSSYQNEPLQQTSSSSNKKPTIQFNNQNNGKIEFKFSKKNSMYAIFNRAINENTDARIFLRGIINNDEITNTLNPVLDKKLSLIRVETGYNLVERNDAENAITRFDMQFFEKNIGAIIQIYEQIKSRRLDLSNIKSKIPSYESTRHLSSILIVIGSWSYYRNKIINTIDLSNNSIKNFKFSFKTVFKDLRKIILIGNKITNDKIDDCFKSFKYILKSESEEDEEEEEEETPPNQPNEPQQDSSVYIHPKMVDDKIEEEEEEIESEKETEKKEDKEDAKDKEDVKEIEIVKKIEEEEEEEEEEEIEMVKADNDDDDDDDDEFGFEEEKNDYYANYINEKKRSLNRPKFKPFKLNQEAPKRIDFSSKKENKKREILKLMPNFCRPKILPTLADFKAIRLNIHEFPPHEFISSFFYDSWQQIETIQNYYSMNSVFSLTVNIKSERDEIDCPSLKFYKEFSRNMFLPNNNNIAVGDSNIASAQKDILFVNGFKAKPTSCSFYQFDENFFYVFHGVFESDIDQNTIPPKKLKEILMFDRSFTIQFQETEFAITNDNLFIHMYSY